LPPLSDGARRTVISPARQICAASHRYLQPVRPRHLSGLVRAAGDLLTNRYYLFKLVERLDMLGIADGPLHELAWQVRGKV
jgi:cation transport regulator ChaC